jgi:hypothetical protein
VKEEAKDLKKRIDRLERDIKKLEDDGWAADTVRGGEGGRQHYKVEGFPDPEYNRKKNLLRRRKALLEQKEEELLELMNQAGEYIDTIDQSDLRMMFRFYYIDNMTWPMVALNMNAHFPKRKNAYTEDGCRMRHNRFLEKNL